MIGKCRETAADGKRGTRREIASVIMSLKPPPGKRQPIVKDRRASSPGACAALRIFEYFPSSGTHLYTLYPELYQKRLFDDSRYNAYLNHLHTNC